jgi:hypothetical protein
MVRRQFPKTVLLRNSENLGYARANNQLIEASRGEFLLFLNPDVQVQAGALEALLELMESDDAIGAVAPRLLNPDGTIQHSCRTFPTLELLFFEFLGLSRLFQKSHLFGKYRLTWWGYDEVREVDQPMASALLLRRKALEQLNGFDEDFPIFFNDVDLCFRLRQGGWKILFTPKAEMFHHIGASTVQMRNKIGESHRSLARFFHKHYRAKEGPVRFALSLALIWASQWPRLAGSYLAGQGKKATQR